MRTRGVRLSLLWLIPVLLAAQNLAEFEKRVTQFTLPNGLRFLVLERHEAPVVSFDMFVNVGDVDDPPGEGNMAHMFEHMIGKGTRGVGTTNWPEERQALQRVEQLYDQLDRERTRANADPAKVKQMEGEFKQAVEAANKFVVPNAFPKLIEEEGGVGFNAGTSQDYTTYFYSLPSNKTELWFLLQSEWLRHPVLREFYKERDVVTEERRMRVESNIIGKLFEKMLETAFTKHPYKTLFAPAKEVQSLRAKDARAFFEKYYVPNNVVIAIVGDVKPEQIKAYAEKYFGNIPAGPKPPRVNVAEPKQTHERRAEVPADTQSFLLMGFKRPSMYDKDDPVFDVISTVLSSGRTGWMYEDLVRDKRIAVQAAAQDGLPGGKYQNLFVFISVPAVGHTVAENEKEINAIITRLQNTKVDDATLKRVKTKVRAGLIRQLDSNSGLASQLAFYEAMYGDWRKMFTAINDINKVTADDVQRVAREYFVPSNETVVFTEPKKTAAAKGDAK